MRKLSKIIVLLISIILFCMPNVTEAKYVLYCTNEIADICIDTIKPTVEGVEEDGKYNNDVKVTYYDNTQIKSAVYFYNNEIKELNIEPQAFESGHIFKQEGYYKIVVTDIYENQTQIETFLIDKTFPQIIGVENGVIYDLPPNVEYYDKYGIEKIEIKTEEELNIEYQYKNSNLKPNSDRTSTTLTAHISYAPKSSIEYKWYIKKEAEIEYKLIDTNLESEYIFTNLEPETRYNIYCIANTSDNKSYMSNIITAQTIKGASNVEIMDVLEDGYKIKVNNIDTKYKYIYFPTWSEVDWQDDIIWYRYEVINNQCIFEFNYKNHNKVKGMYNTHIYLQEEGKKVEYLQSTYIWVGEEEPEKQKTKFTGKVEMTITDTVGNKTNTDYFVDKIITMNLFQIEGHCSYFKIKEILNGKIESYDDEKYIITIKQSNLDSIKELEIKDYIDNEDGYFSGVRYFRKLECLDISGSSRFRADELATLTNLKYLDISNCASNIGYDLGFLNQLRNLEYLNTTGTNITNEEVIKNLPNLKKWKN